MNSFLGFTQKDAGIVNKNYQGRAAFYLEGSIRSFFMGPALVQMASFLASHTSSVDKIFCDTKRMSRASA